MILNLQIIKKEEKFPSLFVRALFVDCEDPRVPYAADLIHF